MPGRLVVLLPGQSSGGLSGTVVTYRSGLVKMALCINPLQAMYRCFRRSTEMLVRHEKPHLPQCIRNQARLLAAAQGALVPAAIQRVGIAGELGVFDARQADACALPVPVSILDSDEKEEKRGLHAQPFRVEAAGMQRPVSPLKLQMSWRRLTPWLQQPPVTTERPPLSLKGWGAARAASRTSPLWSTCLPAAAAATVAGTRIGSDRATRATPSLSTMAAWVVAAAAAKAYRVRENCMVEVAVVGRCYVAGWGRDENQIEEAGEKNRPAVGSEGKQQGREGGWSEAGGGVSMPHRQRVEPTFLYDRPLTHCCLTLPPSHYRAPSSSITLAFYTTGPRPEPNGDEWEGVPSVAGCHFR